MTSRGIAYPSILKIRDALSSILSSAVQHDFLVKNPLNGLRLPPDKRGMRSKPVISPEQFDTLLQLVSEPYATMLYTAVWTGLRVSELIGLKWHCFHEDAITIEERFCRGDWSAPKTQASAATIGVDSGVIARILRLKTLTIQVRAGRAMRNFKLVKAAGPNDLVFQSVKDGKPMRDNNILKRFIKPAARQLGLPFVNLALPTNVTRNLAGAGWRRSQIRPRADAPHAHLDHRGYLCSDRAGGAASSGKEALTLR